VLLTSTGEELLKHVDEIMGALDRAVERISGLDHGLVGSFVIGCHESLGAYFLPDFLDRVLREAPDINVTLHNGGSASVLEAVVSRDIHFGIVVNPHRHPDLVLIELFRDAVDVFVGAPADSPEISEPEAYYGPLGARFTDLDAARSYFENHPLIFPGRVSECRALLEELAKQGFEPSRRLNCGDFGLVKSLALAGIGPALIPRRIAAHGTPQRLRRLHFGLPVYRDAIYLVFRADMHRTRAANHLKEELVRCAKEMPSVAAEGAPPGLSSTLAADEARSAT
ncbi:MAG: LysR family transcriptional regulator substrate-binding protein, partial [Myxococcota bacterium]